MRVFLFIVAVLACLAGFGIFTSSMSAVHEIEGLILFLISVVCLSGAGIIEAINRLRGEIVSQALKG